MLRHLLRPRWVGLTLFALVVVVACVRLGLWQLDRLDDRRMLNARVSAGLAEAPAPLEDLLGEGGPLAYRRAVVMGRYDTDREVILYGRALDGQPGNHVLTPLVLADGRAVIVDRGWVPFELDVPPVTEAAPPSTEVEVEGLLLTGQPDGAGEPRPGDDRVTTVKTVDLGVIGRDVPYDLLPWFLQLQTQSPAAGTLPVPEPPPELTEGPHLSYAFQWFAFAAIAAVGYVILIRRGVSDHPPTTSDREPSTDPTE